MQIFFKSLIYKNKKANAGFFCSLLNNHLSCHRDWNRYVPVTHSADCSQDSESLQTGNQCFEITIFSPSHLHWAALLSTSQCLCQWKSQMKSWGFSHSYEWCFCSSAHQVCAFVFSSRRYKSSQDFCKIHCHSYLELRYISYKSSRGGRKHFLTPDISKFIFSQLVLTATITSSTVFWAALLVFSKNQNKNMTISREKKALWNLGSL